MLLDKKIEEKSDINEDNFDNNCSSFVDNFDFDCEIIFNLSKIKNSICFCHSFKCPKLKHFIVLKMYGHISYVNIGVWKKQIKFLIKLNKNRNSLMNKNVNILLFIY